MKTIRWKPVRHRLLVLTVTLAVSVSAQAQTRKTNNTSLQLGDRVVVIPAPDGFEEAASQFEDVKARFTVTEDPGNDLLAVHLLATDCERLRRGESGSFNFYTKISVRKTARERDFSPSQFAAIAAQFRKSGAAVLDTKRQTITRTRSHL